MELGAGSQTDAPKQQPDPEAALFWTLLDGRNGSDYERFFCHSLEVVQMCFHFTISLMNSFILIFDYLSDSVWRLLFLFTMVDFVSFSVLLPLPATLPCS